VKREGETESERAPLLPESSSHKKPRAESGETSQSQTPPPPPSQLQLEMPTQALEHLVQPETQVRPLPSCTPAADLDLN
jgi:hypothetical protein